MKLLLLSRVILTNPPILLLDELTSGLVGETERTLPSDIRQISTNRTIITFGYKVFVIIVGNTINIIDAGEIVENGSPDELSSKDSWYAIYKRL